MRRVIRRNISSTSFENLACVLYNFEGGSNILIILATLVQGSKMRIVFMYINV